MSVMYIIRAVLSLLLGKQTHQTSLYSPTIKQSNEVVWRSGKTYIRTEDKKLHRNEKKRKETQ
jgi:hypothetical protein